MGAQLAGGCVEDQFGLPRSPVQQPKGDVLAPDEATIFKGKVVNLEGKPIAEAKVASIADHEWRNPVTTGPGGDFALSVEKRPYFVGIKVEAPGFASRCFDLEVREDSRTARGEHQIVEPSGLIRDPLILGPGVRVTGRVLRNGNAVEGVLIGLKHSNNTPHFQPFPRVEFKTDVKGTFHFDHALAEEDFWLNGRLGSLADGDVLVPVRVRTTGDGTALDVGDLHVKKGRTLAGRIVCSDGKAVPSGLVLRASCENVEGDIEHRPGLNGLFEFKGFIDGSMNLLVVFPKGPVPYPYRLSDKNRCLDPGECDRLEGQIDHDITDLTILLERGIQPERHYTLNSQIDQTALADFEDAKKGPIMGVPPRP